MDKNISSNEGTTQQVYIIQLDHNVQFDPQAIPLHILENDLDADLILPLLQQKQSDPMQFFVEPSKQLTDTVTHKQYKRELQNEVSLNSVLNDSIETTVEKVQGQIQNLIHTSEPPKLKKPAILQARTQSIKTEKEFYSDSEIAANNVAKPKIKNYVHISDTKAPPRAVAVLPSALHLRGKLVLPRRTLSSRVRFGPVQGIRKIITKSEAAKLVSDASTPIFLLNHDRDHVIHIDVSDKDKSNWLGLLPLGEVATPTIATSANVWLYEEGGELYALTVQPITARTPLKLGYSKKYHEDHSITQQPVLDLDTVNTVQWWCNECNRALPSAALLQRHADVYHKETIKSSVSSYRCKYCRKPFGRIFTLKRHMHLHCTKIPKKITEKCPEPIENKPESDLMSSLEDNRIPSDESFQNFSNSLDFSTNLFDTDRIALDISQSRVDGDPNDLNPYAIGFRDDNTLASDLGFTKLTNGSEQAQSNETEVEKKPPILDTCAYCNQVIVKKNKSKHLRQCPSRLICECGRVFRHKKSLAIHIRKAHPNIQTEKSENIKIEDDKDMAYKCQECTLAFKRRGMLVNHLWRIHKMILAMPVEKKVKHYPCVACPKIYRSATKRNKHVRVHHPGAEKLHGLSIEGGVKRCQPASCSVCPRQYATRAKLLQHVRAHHPHLAKTIKKQEMEKKAKRKLKTNYVKNVSERYTLGNGIDTPFEYPESNFTM